MKKNLSILLLASILIFLIIGTGFAFQNEPDGFRGLKWGDTPTEDMTFNSQNIYNGNTYYRKGDKLNIGSAKLDYIFYTFNLYNYQFYKISSTFTFKDNYNALKIIFKGKFGEPTLKLKDDYSLIWNGEKVKIFLTFNPKKWTGFFVIESTKILPERPEYNKQKEIEKAEEDF